MQNNTRIEARNQFWNKDWIKERNTFLRVSAPWILGGADTEGVVAYDILQH